MNPLNQGHTTASWCLAWSTAVALPGYGNSVRERVAVGVREPRDLRPVGCGPDPEVILLKSLITFEGHASSARACTVAAMSSTRQPSTV
jgi:hypothetical protein